MIASVSGCSVLKPKVKKEQGMAYFKNPKQAVVAIKTMLFSSDYNKLARYYNLSGLDDTERGQIKSGDFFIRTEKPEMAHPAGFWRYKHPFAPQYNYLSERLITDGVVEVTVDIAIDQGSGMSQRGMQHFYMQHTARGYQILAKPPHEEEANQGAVQE